jgi:hypothetical protein
MEVAAFIYYQRLSLIKRGIRGLATIVQNASRHRCNDTICAHFANPLVANVRNEKITHLIHGYILGIIPVGICRSAAVAGLANGAIASHRRDNVIGGHQPNTLIAGILNQQIARRIQRDTRRII